MMYSNTSTQPKTLHIDNPQLLSKVLSTNKDNIYLHLCSAGRFQRAAAFPDLDDTCCQALVDKSEGLFPGGPSLLAKAHYGRRKGRFDPTSGGTNVCLASLGPVTSFFG